MSSGDKASIPNHLSDETGILFARRSSLLLFAPVVVLFVAARLWRLAASCLWFDEIFSVHAARHSWRDMMHFVAADIIHPPVFYALLKMWISVGGESLLWLRLFPALVSIAAIVPFALLCRELKISSGVMTLALLLMAVNGYLIKYAQELRMYGLLFFFSLCSLWLFLKFLNSEAGSKKQLLALLAINLLLVYTHYGGWILVGLEATTLLLWRRSRLRSFLVSAAILVLLYLPWLYEVAKVTKATE
ncbi:MAG: glycosyltransferase family 39 protein, partial [Acidobacteriota bacterium]|nr:glycosyltransferase family 39 protein [Acidobacteriota bacterium]